MMLFIEIGRHDSPLSTPFRYGGGHRASIGSGAQFRDMVTLMFKFWAAIGTSWIWMYLLYKGDASHESRGLHQRNKKKKGGGGGGGSTKTKTQSVRLGVVSDKEWNCEIQEAKPHSLSSPVMTTTMDVFIGSWSLT
ncbi:hypothetical protein FVEG_16602 [Fusarium verticillioides 7600]|uniref:Uncharacterized protein n=1 Tax=Gibberella moniliformis (strain M3125 / FGSC 7600) TaxID=334819 RepID=W7MRC6_GIBM7|nr:hypothetical protein FVEG_16602 [Fusarium verticillioides 7600]EWG50180.1 hypothetical protein FVEG_16602 [Fusarium verticillioides 7600]